MYGLNNIIARSDSDDESLTPTMLGLLITLLVLVIIGFLALVALFVLRSRRRSRESQLPMYNEKRSSNASSRISSHRRIAVRPTESIIVYQERQSLIDNSEAPPTSPVPEIRITFPEEVDDAGKTQSGRVVVVRVGDHNSIGMEPVSEEKLPAYQKDQSDRFQSVDLERIGGLTEKEVEPRFS